VIACVVSHVVSNDFEGDAWQPLLDGVKNGFIVAFNALVEDPKQVWDFFQYVGCCH
jgi:hypothetical protein